MSTVEKTSESLDFATKNVGSIESGGTEILLPSEKISSSDKVQPTEKGETEANKSPRHVQHDDNEKDSPETVPDLSLVISKPQEKMTNEALELTRELTNGIDKEPGITPLSSEKSFSQLMADSEDLPDTVILPDSEEIKTNLTENSGDKETNSNSKEPDSQDENSLSQLKKVGQSKEDILDNSQDIFDQDTEKLVSSSTPSAKKKATTDYSQDGNLENESQSFSLHLSQTQSFSTESSTAKAEEADSPSNLENKKTEPTSDDVKKESTESTKTASLEIIKEILEQEGNEKKPSDPENTEKKEDLENPVNIEKAVENDSIEEVYEKGSEEKSLVDTPKITTDEELEKKEISSTDSIELSVEKDTNSPTKKEIEKQSGGKDKEEKQIVEEMEEKKENEEKSESKEIKKDGTRKSMRRATREKSEKKEVEKLMKDKNSIGKSEEDSPTKSSKVPDAHKKEKTESQTEFLDDSPQKKTIQNSSNDEKNDELKSQIKEHVDSISMKIIKYVKSKSRNDNILNDCLALLKEIDSLVGGTGTEVLENIGSLKNQRQENKNSRTKKEVKTPLKRKPKETKSEERTSVSPPKKINIDQNEKRVQKSSSKNGLAVFAKWPNSGWYYPGIVEGLAGNEWKDASNVTVCFYDGLRREMKNINILPAHVVPSGSVLCSIDDETEMSVVACERESESNVNFTLVKKDKEKELVQLNFNKLAVKGLNMKSIKQQLEQLNVDIVPKNMHVVSLDNLVCGRRSRGRSLIMKESPMNKKADSPSKKDSKSTNESNSPEKKVENAPQTPARSTPSKRRTRSSINIETPTKRRASARQSVKQN